MEGIFVRKCRGGRVCWCEDNFQQLDSADHGDGGMDDPALLDNHQQSFASSDYDNGAAAESGGHYQQRSTFITQPALNIGLLATMTSLTS